MRRRPAAALLLLLLLPLAGCGSSAEDEAAAGLQDRLDGAQSGHLAARSRDPYSSGADALAALDPYGSSVSTSIGPGGEVTMLLAISAEGSEPQFAAPNRDVTLGACIEVTVVPGSGGADRGWVSTEPVRCPRGTPVEYEGYPVHSETTDLAVRSDPVPEPEPDRSVCHSGDTCTEGGG